MRLPIDELLPRDRESPAHGQPFSGGSAAGAGKTTRVPPALLEMDSREVLVLEPRRLAARLAARFVAGERGEAPGDTVGYQVRFEEVAGPRTRLRFLTEGVLTRRMLSDPDLRDVGCVVLDEFHERHLEGDLALALLRRLQRSRRPDLKIVVMSATLDAAPIAAYLARDDAHAVLRSAGRQYPLEIEYTPHSAVPLEEQVAAALERLAARGLAGHVLVFLPGSFEIRRAQTACSAVARRRGWQVLPLYGDQSPEEQDRAVAPCAGTKIILSTNVAESSITIDGVHAVIDSGLARVASHSPWSGLPALRGDAHQPGEREPAGRTRRAHRTGARHPAVPVRGFRAAAGAGRAANPARGPDADGAAAAGHEPEPEFARLAGRSARRGSGTRARAAAPAGSHRRYRPGNGALSAAPAPEPPDGGGAAPRRGSGGLRGGRVDRRGRASAGARAARLAIGSAGVGGRGVVALCGAAVPATGRLRRARRGLGGRAGAGRRAAAQHTDRLPGSCGAPAAGIATATGRRRCRRAGAQQHGDRRGADGGGGGRRP